MDRTVNKVISVELTHTLLRYRYNFVYSTIIFLINSYLGQLQFNFVYSTKKMDCTVNKVISVVDQGMS
jgi:hypothetical protein